MATKINNQSDQHLVVRSLEVLGKATGGGIETISQNVQALQSAQQTLTAKTENYWTAIANDFIITPEEKKTLYKEYQVILKEYAALKKEAEDKGIGSTYTFYNNFVTAYTNLYTMLNTTYKLFDDMSINTELTSRNDFIGKYESYYETRDFLRSVLYSGDIGIATYNADLTPEVQVISVDSSGSLKDPSAVIMIKTQLLEGADGADYAATRQAIYQDQVIGTWTGDTLTFAASILNKDTNYIYITLTDSDNVSITAIATVTKVYAGDEADYNFYDMQLSDGSVKVSSDGVANPSKITAKKIRRSRNLERETNYGSIKASIDNGPDQVIGGYKLDDKAVYTPGEKYYQKWTPYIIKFNNDQCLAISSGTAAIFYKRSN